MTCFANRRSAGGSTRSLSTRTDSSGGYCEGAIPDPIPNSEVKPFCADGTARLSVWESRSPPEPFEARRTFVVRRAFFVSMVTAGRPPEADVHTLCALTETLMVFGGRRRRSRSWRSARDAAGHARAARRAMPCSRSWHSARAVLPLAARRAQPSRSRVPSGAVAHARGAQRTQPSRSRRSPSGWLSHSGGRVH